MECKTRPGRAHHRAGSGTTGARRHLDRLARDSNGDGDLGHAVTQPGEHFGYTLRPVMLSPAEVEGFYAGFANEVLWPLFHDLPSFCKFRLAVLAELSRGQPAVCRSDP